MYPLKASLFFLICNPTVNIWNSILVYKKQRNLHGETHPCPPTLRGDQTPATRILKAYMLLNRVQSDIQCSWSHTHITVSITHHVLLLNWPQLWKPWAELITFQRQGVWSLWLFESKEQVHLSHVLSATPPTVSSTKDALVLFSFFDCPTDPAQLIENTFSFAL